MRGCFGSKPVFNDVIYESSHTIVSAFDRGFDPRRGRSYNILLKPYTRPKEAILVIEYRLERNNKAEP